MPPRQTLPTMWLMTDQRLSEDLWATLDRLPRGAGVVLRHHGSDAVLGKRVAARCQERGVMLAVAGDVALARSIGAAMVHNPDGETAGLLVSRSVHDAREAEAARDADLLFVSPVLATRSHPGAEPIGIDRALALATIAGVPAIALGGMDETRGNAAIRAGFHGWAAIDAWTK